MGENRSVRQSFQIFSGLKILVFRSMNNRLRAYEHLSLGLKISADVGEKSVCGKFITFAVANVGDWRLKKLLPNH